MDGSVSSWRLLGAQLFGMVFLLIFSLIITGIYFAVLHGLLECGIVADSCVRANRLNELQVRPPHPSLPSCELSRAALPRYL